MTQGCSDRGGGGERRILVSTTALSLESLCEPQEQSDVGECLGPTANVTSIPSLGNADPHPSPPSLKSGQIGFFGRF